MTLRRRSALAALAAAPAALAAPAVFGQPATRIRIAGNFATEHSSSIAIEGLKAEVARLSGGRMEVDTFPAMQLGGAQENVSQVRAGTLLMTWVGMAFLPGPFRSSRRSACRSSSLPGRPPSRSWTARSASCSISAWPTGGSSRSASWSSASAM